MATKKKQYKSNFKDTLATNTTYRTISVPKAINNSTMPKEIITKEEYNTNFDSRSTNANAIKANSNPSIQKRTTTTNNKTALSSNQFTASRTSSNTNKVELATIKATVTENKEEMINVTVTENEEETIFNKVVKYIEIKINNQPILTKERISTTLKNITTYIDNKQDIYHLLNSNTWDY
ncbi:hypothetical protein O181_121416 [Austropuccinia psidii MF-1]|uniref:Uncharacterized protein n=1 Tax=Austropuccinia psidii MF-1 TaxID=1389203 RepID=A0A9Q3KJL2_9BASI|nr:hypothetical protein [Austropuccinia psidii MF-1]